MAYSLLGFFLKKTEKYPDVPPDFAVQIGWMCLAFVALLVLWAWIRGESVRRALLSLEDPRTFALLRIMFALMTIGCFVNLEPHWHMLWSDEGVFDMAYAQDRLGRTALRGWSPEEGFFDFWAIGNFLWNKPSLHYMYGSPNFVIGYMVAFCAVLTAYAVGFRSRITGVLAWLMMSGLYNRNALYWEGTDTVYRSFWFILLFAKTGHAWSVDNWLRCRWLRKRGRLEEHNAKPPEQGAPVVNRQPIYRLIPAWPRYLFMLQLAAVYVTTGSVKHGSVWYAGDALYYSLNMDHFYRFEHLTQYASSLMGMNLFRTATWVTHWWERFFPFVLFGCVLKFGLMHKHQAWYQRQNVWWRRAAGWAVLIAAWALVYRIVISVHPYCVALRDDKIIDASDRLVWAHVVFAVVVPLFALLWTMLAWWQLHPTRWLKKRFSKLSWLPDITIDQEFLRAWILGRRVFLTLGIIFHGILIGFMNIGFFAPIMLTTYIAFIRGDEWVAMFRWLRRFKLVRKITPKDDGWLAPAQAPQTVKLRGRSVPNLVVLVFGLVGLGLIYGKVDKVEWIGKATYWWLATGAATALVFRFIPVRLRDRTPEPGPALAYTAFGRTLVLGAVLWHTSAVTLHLFPSYPIFNKWRSKARGTFGSWLRGTGTSQSWRMFSPNPPRSNTFMRTVVVLDNDERWDLRNNTFHYNMESGPDSRPNPWIFNDRIRKMQRRMVGKGKWYLRYYAEYQCRNWALEHGEVPKQIDFSKFVTRIPKPEITTYWAPNAKVASFKGKVDHSTGATWGEAYNPRKLKVTERDVQEQKCKEGGKLPLRMLERYGLPITEQATKRADKESKARVRKFAKRRDTWEKRKDWGRWWVYEEEQAKKKAEREQAKAKRKIRPTRPKPEEVAPDDTRDQPDGDGAE